MVRHIGHTHISYMLQNCTLFSHNEIVRWIDSLNVYFLFVAICVSSIPPIRLSCSGVSGGFHNCSWLHYRRIITCPQTIRPFYWCIFNINNTTPTKHIHKLGVHQNRFDRICINSHTNK